MIRKMIALVMALCMSLTFAACASANANTQAGASAPSAAAEASVPAEEAVSVQEETQSGKKVIILATGGTIAGVGDQGKTAGYKPGSLTAEDLISAVPELEDVAAIEAI